jgi:hypothetical protein
MRPRVRRSRLFMGGVAGVVFVLAIANSAASVGFPIGQQWERVVNALVTVDLLVAFLILLAVVLIGARRDAALADGAGSSTVLRPTVIDQSGQEVGATPAGPGVLAPLGLVLIAVDWVLWMIFALPAVLHALLVRESGYLYGVLPFVLFGPILVLGTVFAVVGFHRGGSRLNRIVSLLGAGLALLMMAVAVTLGMLCATGILR